MAEEGAVRVTVVFSAAPRHVAEWPVTLAPGATVLDALDASGLRSTFPELDLQDAPVGVWGRKAGLEQILRDRDRVEVYRPLKVDPKLARRERFKRQGARAPGLFARKQAGPRTGD
jgi:putative ubiquitin-RnfH superfamily antitoxin RatB of RatAB toxin-antitoxin module